MFDSNRNNQNKPRKRFWPFGKKRREDQADSREKEIKIEPEKSPDTTNHNLDRASEAADLMQTAAAQPDAPATDPIESPTVSTRDVPKENHEQAARKNGLFSRMRSGLAKTRRSFIGGMVNILAGKKKIDEELLEELEMQLITADIGVETTTAIIAHLTQQLKRKELDNMDTLMASLKQQLHETIKTCEHPLVITDKKPFVILVVGVNGVGKTTTIGKLANQLQQSGKKIMLAAGDTFRAAAVEQLEEWGQRNNVPVIAQHDGADSASVIYDAYNAAKSRDYDVLIADTAGRLHNKENLMNELKKIRRILSRLDDSSPHEVMLVVDAGTGQNAIQQARIFNEAVGLTGMTLTKLDGTAKGGIVFALAKTMHLPIRYLGVGEKVSDLRPFSSQEFVNALFENTDNPAT